MENHPIDTLIKSTLENLKEMIDVNTIVGDSIQTNDGTLIIPISKVSFGFASGGSEFDKNNSNSNNPNYPFGGGSGAGVTLRPVAFIIIKDGSVRLISLDHTNTYDKLVDSIPQILDIVKDMNKNNKCTKNKDDKKSKENKTNNDSDKHDNNEENNTSSVFNKEDASFYACDNEIED